MRRMSSEQDWRPLTAEVLSQMSVARSAAASSRTGNQNSEADLDPQVGVVVEAAHGLEEQERSGIISH